jgi:hypothetical protein
MKILSFIGLLAFGPMLVAPASAGAADVTVTEITPDRSLPLVQDPSELAPVSAQGVINPNQVLAAQGATSVPESAAAGFVAMLGYFLILRRRTA